MQVAAAQCNWPKKNLQKHTKRCWECGFGVLGVCGKSNNYAPRDWLIWNVFAPFLGDLRLVFFYSSSALKSIFSRRNMRGGKIISVLTPFDYQAEPNILSSGFSVFFPSFAFVFRCLFGWFLCRSLATRRYCFILLRAPEKKSCPYAFKVLISDGAALHTVASTARSIVWLSHPAPGCRLALLMQSCLLWEW
jgi:hypothetical protein